MTFSTHVKDMLRPLQLLSHPFYQAWTKGELTTSDLQHYAEQYQPFINAFPRYVSALHSHCEDDSARAEILENLMDEEGKTNRSAPHPKLWDDFISAFGPHRTNVAYGKEALNIKDVYLNLCRSSYAEGMCALYAYEYQTPEISKTKIDGLKKYYGLTDPSFFEFFKVHEIADIYHAKTCEKLMDALPLVDQEKGLNAAKLAASSLWDFLTESYNKHTAC